MAGSLGLSVVPTTHAQYFANFQTNIISGITSNWTGDYVIGNGHTSNNVLLIQNGGVLSNSGTGCVGCSGLYPPGNDKALVTDPGSIWSIGGDLYSVGLGDSVVVSNGGRVFNNGTGYVEGSGGMLVTGVGSVWSNQGSLYLGQASPYNTLVISNGGQVVSSWGWIGYTYYGFSNSAKVTGTGSVWYAGLNLSVGGAESSLNRLSIENGGKIVDAFGGSSGSGRSNNIVVTGNGSVWSNQTMRTSGSLVVSNEGLVVTSVGTMSGYSTRIVDGGMLRSGILYLSTSTVVDDGYISATNVVLSCFGNLQVNGGSLIVTNATHDATLNMGGTFTLNGGTLQVDKLVMTNSCISFIHDGGTVIAGSVVLDPNAFRITSITQQGNDLNITWLMGPGQTNTLQVITGDGHGGYRTNGFTDIFVATNNPVAGTVTNYLDVGGATNVPARYYRARLVP